MKNNQQIYNKSNCAYLDLCPHSAEHCEKCKLSKDEATQERYRNSICGYSFEDIAYMQRSGALKRRNR